MKGATPKPASTPRRRPVAVAPRAGDAETVGRRSRAASTPGTTPNTILEAALKIFARDGFDGATMPAIAKAASIGHPLIHYHFGSKENLWRAAVDHAFGDLARGMAALEDASRDLEPIDALQMLCREFAAFTARHPLHTLIVLGEVRRGGERFDWLVERYLKPLHARLDRAIDTAAAAGQIRPIPAVHLASIAVGATAHFFGAAPLALRLYGVDVHDADVAKAHTDWILEVLLHGLSVEKGPRDRTRKKPQRQARGEP